MKYLITVVFLLSLTISYSQDKSESINVNVTTENVTANPVGSFNSARMREWQNMRRRRYNKYIADPSKFTATKLLRANKVIGLPLNEGITDIDMKRWFPDVKIPEKIEKPISREEAIKRLKENKELLEQGILTQDEYDKLTTKYKKIILEN